MMQKAEDLKRFISHQFDVYKKDSLDPDNNHRNEEGKLEKYFKDK